ncbi:hypothetical protein MY11210_007809 [Beauveria gryllotalpidicola]
MRIPIGTLHDLGPQARSHNAPPVPTTQHDALASHYALLGHTLAHNISDSRQRTQSAPPAHKTLNGIPRYPRLAPGAVYPCQACLALLRLCILPVLVPLLSLLRGLGTHGNFLRGPHQRLLLSL